MMIFINAYHTQQPTTGRSKGKRILIFSMFTCPYKGFLTYLFDQWRYVKKL